MKSALLSSGDLGLDHHLLRYLRCPNSFSGLRLSEDRSYLQSEVGAFRYSVVQDIPILHGAEPPVDELAGLVVEVSVLLMALNEASNIDLVISEVARELRALKLSHEIVVVDGGSRDGTALIAAEAGARVLKQATPGYANGLIQGFKALRGRYVLTLDGDCSHDPLLVKELIRAAAPGCIVIGSRWMPGGSFEGPWVRKILSRVLNAVFTRVLHIPVADISSGYRLYAREALFPDEYRSQDFSILEEVLVRARTEGFDLREIPLRFKPRKDGESNVRLCAFAMSYLATLGRMWMLRHDANAADYDYRAYDSLNLVQRWWQRMRYRNIRALMQGHWFRGDVLDVGCGSSRIIQTLGHAVAFDVSLKKLRFLKNTNPLRVCGSALNLPFQNHSFDCVLHSQLIEHLPPDDAIFRELHRVLRPGGTLIIGTVDFGTWIWPTIERIYAVLLPHAYAEEHITRYSLKSLTDILSQFGFRVEEVKTILRGEITLRAIRI